MVSCGRSKIWKINPNAGSALAKDAYIGAPFRVNREYAEKFADRWVILSAKYGFIDPDFVIAENYDVTFMRPETNPVGVGRLIDRSCNDHRAVHACTYLTRSLSLLSF